jgi:hypothetical protein
LAHAHTYDRKMETLARWGAGLLGFSTTAEQSTVQGTTSTRVAPYTSTEADTFAHNAHVDGGETDTLNGSTPTPATQCHTNPSGGGEDSDMTRTPSHQVQADFGCDGADATLHTESTESLPGVLPPWEVAQGFESDNAAVEYTKKYALHMGFTVSTRDSDKVRALKKS